MEKQDIRICFIGDSFVNGTGDPEFLGWTGRLCAAALTPEIELTYYNLGIRRDTSADIAQRWQREAQARLPNGSDNRLVFSFGVNDTTYNGTHLRVEQEQSVANARSILIEAMRQYPVLMIGPLPIYSVDDEAQSADKSHNARSRELDKAFEHLCHEIGVPYLSVFDAMFTTPVWEQEVVANDGAHPLAGGYAALANVVRAWDAWWF